MNNRARWLFGFTVIEMIVVIALLGILTMMIIPNVRAARNSAKQARTKAQFTQWGAAIEAFRAEYGYYPAFDSSGLVNGGVGATDHLFHDLLAAKRRDFAALTAGSAAALQNRKLIAFYLFRDADFTATGLLKDAQDNTAIAVLVDRDLDGVIQSGTDFTLLPAVAGMTPGNADFPSSGVRAGVLFYAPAPDATLAKPAFIMSWK